MTRDRPPPGARTRRKLPSASLGFLGLAYSVLGWTIADMGHSHWLWWLLASIVSLAGSVLLSLPLAYWRASLLRWFESELLYFISVFVGAFMVAVLLAWVHFLLVGLLLFSAMALARLDLLTARFTGLQSCLILAVTAEAGLGFGWMLQHLMLI